MVRIASSRNLRRWGRLVRPSAVVAGLGGQVRLGPGPHRLCVLHPSGGPSSTILVRSSHAIVSRPPWRQLATTAPTTVTGLAVRHPAPVNLRDERCVGNLGRLLSRSRKSRYALPEQAVLNCQ